MPWTDFPTIEEISAQCISFEIKIKIKLSNGTKMTILADNEGRSVELEDDEYDNT